MNGNSNNRRFVLDMGWYLLGTLIPMGVGFIKTPIIYNTPILNVDWTREEIDKNLPHWLYMEESRAGRAILKGVARNRGMIVFPFHARFAWWLVRLYPPLFDRIARLQIKGFRKYRDPKTA